MTRMIILNYITLLKFDYEKYKIEIFLSSCKQFKLALTELRWERVRQYDRDKIKSRSIFISLLN